MEEENGFVAGTIDTRFSLHCLRLSIQTFLGHVSLVLDPVLDQAGHRDTQDLPPQELLLTWGDQASNNCIEFDKGHGRGEKRPEEESGKASCRRRHFEPHSPRSLDTGRNRAEAPLRRACRLLRYFLTLPGPARASPFLLILWGFQALRYFGWNGPHSLAYHLGPPSTSVPSLDAS